MLVICDFLCFALKAEEELEEILVWSPKSEILKRAQATGGRIAPGFNET